MGNSSLLQLSLKEPWLDFYHPVVRDLAFTVASPNIINQKPESLSISHDFNLHDAAFWQRHYQRYYLRLKALDQDPAELIHFLSQLKSSRLGLYFEYLLWFWLLDRSYHHYEVLGHSVQKIDGAHTRGELDFLLFNHDTQQIEHWEVALKYYLAESDYSLDCWKGLNREDTLLKKLNHFTQKQFQFNEALNYQIEQRYAVVKGQLFLPEIQTQHLAIPNWLNLDRRIGQWGSQTKEGYYRLSRREWLCPHIHRSSNAVLWWTNGLYVNYPTQDQFYMFRVKQFVSQYKQFDER